MTPSTRWPVFVHYLHTHTTSKRGWSDTTFGAERLRLEALDEDDAQTQHEPEVIGVEDRADGLVLADL
jgi:hypothetical protein